MLCRGRQRLAASAMFIARAVPAVTSATKDRPPSNACVRPETAWDRTGTSLYREEQPKEEMEQQGQSYVNRSLDLAHSRKHMRSAHSEAAPLTGGYH